MSIRALSEIHSAGIIHGDIKPSNLITGIFYPIETLKLIDFETAFMAYEDYRPPLRLTPLFCSLN